MLIHQVLLRGALSAHLTARLARLTREHSDRQADRWLCGCVGAAGGPCALNAHGVQQEGLAPGQVQMLLLVDL